MDQKPIRGPQEPTANDMLPGLNVRHGRVDIDELEYLEGMAYAEAQDAWQAMERSYAEKPRPILTDEAKAILAQLLPHALVVAKLNDEQRAAVALEIWK